MNVPLEEAIEQVKIAWIRLAQLHLAFSKTLVNELGDKKGKELILKSIIDYGYRIAKRSKKHDQINPFYGIHGKYEYGGNEYIDTREILELNSEGSLDLSDLRIHDCVLANIFKETNEEELGKFYCYIDAAKSMASDSSTKAVHTKCVLCGDDYCQIASEETTETERIDFKNRNEEWKTVDTILLE